MHRRQTTIDDVRKELEKLDIATEELQKKMSDLRSQNQRHNPPSSVTQASRQECKTAVDRDGRRIHIEDHVRFLTKGWHTSTEGIVRRFSRNNERVFSIDPDGLEISRAPMNVIIIDGIFQR